MGCGSSKNKAPDPKPAATTSTDQVTLLDAPTSSGKTGVAVVTGAGSGMGKALALLLAKNGVKVVGVDKNSKTLQDLKGDGITACLADLDTVEGIGAVVKAVGDSAVHILMLNAGCLIAKPLLDMDRASMDAMIGPHINSPIFLTQALVPNLKKAGEARVLCTCGGILDVYVPSIGGYSATKAAMKTLRLALRDELAEFAAFGLCFPGPTKTPMFEALLADPNFVLKDAFQPRFDSGDVHTAEETAEWMAALLNKNKCETQAFKEREHNIDNPEHQCGVTVTLTSEGKAFQSKPEEAPAAAAEVKAEEPKKADPQKAASEMTAVVTGAASGIGKALALLLAKNGMKVLGVDKNEKTLKDLKGERISTCLADVGTAEGVKALAKAVGDGEVNIFALNAGSLIAKAVLAIDRASMKAMSDAHICAPIFATQALLQNLKKAGNARILLTCGGGWDVHIPTFGPYGATKAAMKVIALHLRNECAEFASVGICFPGPTKTPMFEALIADPNWPLTAVFKPRIDSGDVHTAEETAEWMAALLNETSCESQVFRERDHSIDNPMHQCGVKVTLTSEGRAFEEVPMTADQSAPVNVTVPLNGIQ